jgi:hypothetical protein
MNRGRGPIIQVGIYALPTAELGDGTLTSKAFQDNAYLLLRGKLATGLAADILDRFFSV